ncbi:MAG: single-stranded DNA-binding protein [Ignavibacteriaceae bacterium]|nr:single-stranded DNA-binding protein [Ignavibacteriaceae bacterium]
MADLKMPEVNYVLISGNLTRDPMYRQTASSTPVCNFVIASNRKYRDGNNNWLEDVCFVGIVAWNKLAESCRENLKKGSAVVVDGELQSRSWKTEQGFIKHVVEVKARRIQFLNIKRLNGSNNGHDNYGNEESVFADDENNDYLEDSFDKFLSNEESDLLK